MFAYPGKKLLFMGAEIAQGPEWNHHGPFAWDALGHPRHAGVHRLVRDLNRVYRTLPALHERDSEPGQKGTYVSFPRDALLSAICAASRSHRCLVIGEDLGTVPDGVRERMRARHMLTTSVMRFEQRDGAFIPPSNYPRMTTACAGTHDLVPLAGYAAGTDISARALAAPGSEDVAAARAARANEVSALAEALSREGLAQSGPGEPADSTELADALVRTGDIFAQEGRGRL